MNKYACYCLTRNLYDKLIPALRSLLKHSDVTRVFLIIEDDALPYPVPSYVKCINVSGQSFFGRDCPNAHHKWTYMVLMRAALAKILPDYVESVLSLDVDTIVDKDISEIWYFTESPSWQDYYLAASVEPAKSSPWFYYVNCGVVMWNLKKMRDGMADTLIDCLNFRRYDFAEQDCVNEECAGQIALLPSDYNACPFTIPTENPKIHHFAAQPDYFETQPLVKKYLAE